ncbi:nuclease [Nakamurella endophytica]|uniref:Nuclease n=1 Tax=Nakamurella endophytica TaxID=1748367 RepID=A0A917SSM4_9ACTN|nr:nuclease [Nakamurella endophytica]
MLNRRPEPAERPRWERVLEFARSQWGNPVKGLFFLNASSGHLPSGFVQALVSLGWTVIPVAGPPEIKVVDAAIQKTLGALLHRTGDVMLLSHDADFVADVRALQDGRRRLGLIAFTELVSGAYGELAAAGLTVFDLEDHVKAFNVVLPRIRIIPIELFDPERFL